jgi:hypothetical protein
MPIITGAGQWPPLSSFRHIGTDTPASAAACAAVNASACDASSAARTRSIFTARSLIVGSCTGGAGAAASGDCMCCLLLRRRAIQKRLLHSLNVEKDASARAETGNAPGLGF